MSLLVAGIDGGQSSTVALVGDERGHVLGRGTAGPADEVGVAPGVSTRLHDALSGALLQALRAADISDGCEFAAIVAGISGFEGRIYGAQPDLPTRTFRVLHDAPIAHAGALAGIPGVVVIAGTGSVVYSRDGDGTERTFGGWGYCFGDEGSAFGIARDALAQLMRAADHADGAADALACEAQSACEFFARGSLREIARAFYADEIARERIAAFAPCVVSLPRFRPLIERHGGQLAELAGRALSKMESRTVALAGGLFTEPSYYDRVAGGIVAVSPDARIVRSKYEPAGGALLLAYRELGIPVTELS